MHVTKLQRYHLCKGDKLNDYERKEDKNLTNGLLDYFELFLVQAINRYIKRREGE